MPTVRHNMPCACERAVRTFCIGKKNWMFHDSVMGAQASAVIYSLSETAKLNDLRPYYYFKHLLTELPNLCDEEGNIEPATLDHLLPWSKELPIQYLLVADTKIYKVKEIDFHNLTIEANKTDLTIADVPEDELWDIDSVKIFSQI